MNNISTRSLCFMWIGRNLILGILTSAPPSSSMTGCQNSFYPQSSVLHLICGSSVLHVYPVGLTKPTQTYLVIAIFSGTTKRTTIQMLIEWDEKSLKRCWWASNTINQLATTFLLVSYNIAVRRLRGNVFGQASVICQSCNRLLLDTQICVFVIFEVQVMTWYILDISRQWHVSITIMDANWAQGWWACLSENYIALWATLKRGSNQKESGKGQEGSYHHALWYD